MEQFPQPKHDNDKEKKTSRRSFLRALGAGLVGGAIPGSFTSGAPEEKSKEKWVNPDLPDKGKRMTEEAFLSQPEVQNAVKRIHAAVQGAQALMETWLPVFAVMDKKERRWFEEYSDPIKKEEEYLNGIESSIGRLRVFHDVFNTILTDTAAAASAFDDTTYIENSIVLENIFTKMEKLDGKLKRMKDIEWYIRERLRGQPRV